MAARRARRLAAHQQIKNDAAIVVQTRVRKLFKQKDGARRARTRKEEMAAAKIQGLVRGRCDRKRGIVLHEEAARRTNAAVTLQRRARLNAARAIVLTTERPLCTHQGATAVDLGRDQMRTLAQQKRHLCGE